MINLSYRKILTIVLVVFGLLAGSATLASEGDKIINPFDNLQIGIPGATRFQEAKVSDDKLSLSTTWIAEYIVSIYKWGIGALGIIAMMAIAIGGVLWIVSAGNPSRIGEAKAWITSGLTGLTLGLGAYILLGMINIDLVSFKPINMEIVRDELPGPDDYQDMANNTGSFIEYEAPEDIVTLDVPISDESEVRLDNKSTFVLGNKVVAGNKINTEVETTGNVKKVQVHKSIAANLQMVMAEVKKIGFEVKDIGGYRPSSKHCHGKGLAVDINVDENYCIDCYGTKGKRVGLYYNPRGVPLENIIFIPDEFSIPKEVVDIFENAGWCWGGDWKSFKDYMHFSINCSPYECTKDQAPFDWNLSVKENHKRLNITY